MSACGSKVEKCKGKEENSLKENQRAEIEKSTHSRNILGTDSEKDKTVSWSKETKTITWVDIVRENNKNY